MKIAYCLYGQPRLFEKGYEIISEFIKDYDVDFYYHTWSLENSTDLFQHSCYRNINCEELKFDKNTIQKLNLLYKPKAYISETSKTFEYKNDINFINSITYTNTRPENKLDLRINNAFSNFYSKQQVRNLLNETVKKENINYDLVIISRFDMLKNININLNKLDKSKIYVSDLHRPNFIFSDAILISNIDNFLNIINVYDNFPNILNNSVLSELCEKYNIKMMFIPEHLIFANYLYCYGDLQKLEYINFPNFM